MPSRSRKALKAVGLDFVCISSGGISADTRPTLVANTNVEFAEKVKREVGIATRTVGLIATPKQAEAIIADGKADMVALARAMLDDPALGLARGSNARCRGRPSQAVPARRAEGVGGRELSRLIPACLVALRAIAADHDHRETMARKRAESFLAMDAFVFVAVLFAAACHAGWNATIKGGLDPLATTVLISIGAATRLAGIPAGDRLAGRRRMAVVRGVGADPSRLFRRADRELPRRRHGAGLSDRARIGAA